MLAYYTLNYAGIFYGGLPISPILDVLRTHTKSVSFIQLHMECCICNENFVTILSDKKSLHFEVSKFSKILCIER